MAKSRNDVTVWNELAAVGLYKRNQGRLTRQLTAVGLGLVLFLGCWTLSQGPLARSAPWLKVGVPAALAAAGAWVVFRMVNYPRFADFLISVEAEMDKVTWAGKDELYRSTVVVISTMLFLGLVLFVYDLIWQWFFSGIGLLQLEPTEALGR